MNDFFEPPKNQSFHFKKRAHDSKSYDHRFRTILDHSKLFWAHPNYFEPDRIIALGPISKTFWTSSKLLERSKTVQTVFMYIISSLNFAYPNPKLFGLVKKIRETNRYLLRIGIYYQWWKEKSLDFSCRLQLDMKECTLLSFIFCTG